MKEEQKKPITQQMRNVWKVVSVFLFLVFAITFTVDFSMYYWPSLPASPQPAEGRIYPLNNHGRYTYMNRREYELDQAAEFGLPLLLGAIGAIYYFIDPFDLKERQRRYRRPPRDFKP